MQKILAIVVLVAISSVWYYVQPSIDCPVDETCVLDNTDRYTLWRVSDRSYLYIKNAKLTEEDVLNVANILGYNKQYISSLVLVDNKINRIKAGILLARHFRIDELVIPAWTSKRKKTATYRYLESILIEVKSNIIEIKPKMTLVIGDNLWQNIGNNIIQKK